VENRREQRKKKPLAFLTSLRLLRHLRYVTAYIADNVFFAVYPAVPRSGQFGRGSRPAADPWSGQFRRGTGPATVPWSGQLGVLPAAAFSG
jgi:hypothetical protein